METSSKGGFDLISSDTIVGHVNIITPFTQAEYDGMQQVMLLGLPADIIGRKIRPWKQILFVQKQWVKKYTVCADPKRDLTTNPSDTGNSFYQITFKKGVSFIQACAYIEELNRTQPYKYNGNEFKLQTAFTAWVK